MYLMIQNAGEVHHRAFTLLGASVKDEGAIGMFGSGTKYALAKLIREGLTPRIFSGEDEITVEVKPSDFRGKTFDIIWINGVETSLTTNTGPQWRTDHAVREFWSNALDEGEAQISITQTIVGEVGATRIFIPMNEDVKKMWENWDQHFLNSKAEPIMENMSGEMYRIEDTGDTGLAYRRGVWCVEDTGFRFIFSYNFKSLKLPETRVLPSADFGVKIDWILMNLCDEDLIHHMMKTLQMWPGKHFVERQALQWIHPSEPEIWLAAMKREWDWYCTDRAQLDYFAEADRDRVYIASEYHKGLFNKIKFPSVYDYLGSVSLYKIKPWPIGAEQRVTEARQLVEAGGVIKISWPIHFAEFKDSDTIAQSDMKKDIILMGDKAFETDDPTIIYKALIEEWTHLKHGVNDHTVQQQHVYLDTIIQLLKKVQ